MIVNVVGINIVKIHKTRAHHFKLKTLEEIVDSLAYSNLLFGTRLKFI